MLAFYSTLNLQITHDMTVEISTAVETKASYYIFSIQCLINCLGYKFGSRLLSLLSDWILVGSVSNVTRGSDSMRGRALNREGGHIWWPPSLALLTASFLEGITGSHPPFQWSLLFGRHDGNSEAKMYPQPQGTVCPCLFKGLPSRRPFCLPFLPQIRKSNVKFLDFHRNALCGNHSVIPLSNIF